MKHVKLNKEVCKTCWENRYPTKDHWKWNKKDDQNWNEHKQVQCVHVVGYISILIGTTKCEYLLEHIVANRADEVKEKEKLVSS